MKSVIFDLLLKRNVFTDSEIRQAILYRDFLASSKTNSELESFLSKAIKNTLADKIENTLSK